MDEVSTPPEASKSSDRFILDENNESSRSSASATLRALAPFIAYELILLTYVVQGVAVWVEDDIDIDHFAGLLSIGLGLMVIGGIVEVILQRHPELRLQLVSGLYALCFVILPIFNIYSLASILDSDRLTEAYLAFYVYTLFLLALLPFATEMHRTAFLINGGLCIVI
jgi:hypothetical protein